MTSYLFAAGVSILLAAAPAAGQPQPPAYRLRPGAVVVGWLPPALPDSAFRQYSFQLLSHVLYPVYEAGADGLLTSPAADPAALVRFVRQANPACRVLLSVQYRPPASGPGLFAPARAAERQQLARAIARQVQLAHAAGVQLDFELEHAAHPSTRPGHLAKAGADMALSSPAAALQQQAASLARRQAALRADSLVLDAVDRTRKLRQFAPPDAPALAAALTADSRPLALRRQFYQQHRASYLRRQLYCQLPTLTDLRLALDSLVQDSMRLAAGPENRVSPRQKYNRRRQRLLAATTPLVQERDSLHRDSLTQALSNASAAAFGQFAGKVRRRQQQLAAARASQQAALVALAARPTALVDFVRELVSVLRQDDPTALLALRMPAIDPAGDLALHSAEALVQLRLVRLPAAAPPAAWDSAASQARRFYYRAAGLPPAQLALELGPPPFAGASAWADTVGWAARCGWLAGCPFGSLAVPVPPSAAANALAILLVRARLALPPPAPPAAEAWLVLPPLVQAGLSVLVLALAFGLLGFVVGVLVRGPRIVPYTRRRGYAGLVMIGPFVIIGAYLVFIANPHTPRPLLIWMLSVPPALLLGLWLQVRRRRLP